MYVLGIETSCDETGIAIVEDGKRVLSDFVYSQIDLHKSYGGVVPELAARKHTETLDEVLDMTLSGSKMTVEDVDGIAVTYGPGLPGALLVGIAFAKGLAWAYRKPIVPVNHVEAHLESAGLQFQEKVVYPAIGLVVSGGHTSLFEIEKPGLYRLIGKTRDDAAGEAFDKVAKLLGLGYPGGPAIDRIYNDGDHSRFKFSRPRFSDGSSDFSFSGLKTAVIKIIKETPEEKQDDKFKKDLAASFQEAAIGILIDALADAIKKSGPRSVIITGGVAANSLLRRKAAGLEEDYGIPCFIPDTRFCTDNGVIVAALGCRLLREGKTAGFDLDAEPNLRLGETGARRSNRYRP